MVVHEGGALFFENKAESHFFMGLVKFKLFFQGYYISRKVSMENILSPLFFRQSFLFFCGQEKVSSCLVICKL